MLEILSYRFKEEFHQHKCPRCKKVSRETNMVCGKTSGDHVFICLVCLQDYRLRLGTDVLLDSYINQNQLDRFQEVAPDEKADALDLVDRYRKEQQVRAVIEKMKSMPPAPPPTVQQKAQATHEALDKMREEAEVLTYEEVESEIAKEKERNRI